MAEFVRTMKDWRRMCVYYTEKRGCNSCDICPLRGCGAIYEDDGHTDYTEIGEKVAAWAAEHPEPVYQTWGEWFVSRKMLPEKWDNLTSAYMNVGCVPSLLHSPIPADLAEKLGLEPKEG